MSEPNDSESNFEYFNRRVNEVAAEIDATVVSSGHARDHDALEAQLMLAGEYGFISASPAWVRSDVDAESRKRMWREIVDRSIANVADQLYAVTHTEIPAGAVFMARGARRVYGSSEPLPPIQKIDRAGRAYWRGDDTEPLPWPPVIFYSHERCGFVEHVEPDGGVRIDRSLPPNQTAVGSTTTRIPPPAASTAAP